MNTFKRVHFLIWLYQLSSIFILFLDGSLKLVYNAKILPKMSAVVTSCEFSVDIDATLHHSKNKSCSVAKIDQDIWKWIFFFYFSAFKIKGLDVSVCGEKTHIRVRNRELSTDLYHLIIWLIKSHELKNEKFVWKLYFSKIYSRKIVTTGMASSKGNNEKFRNITRAHHATCLASFKKW